MNLATSLRQFDPAKLAIVERKISAELEKRREKLGLESRLIDFVEAAWSSIDSADYQKCWAIDAVCDHLEAVTLGHIKRLLINIPPRCSKTTVASICWPAWTWTRRWRGFCSGPQVKFLCASYNGALALESANKTRRLVYSPWYQARWGKDFQILDDQNSKEQFDNSEGGSRKATSVSGSLLGIGGDIIDCDDLHNTRDVESEAERETVMNFWKEIRSTRLNDPKRGAIAVTMQRLHEEDVSGLIQSGDDYDEWTHLMIPMRHDERRHCVTVLKWDDKGEPADVFEDPRSGGELMWPERFGEREVAGLERDLGPYMASGRLQQSPAPKGGGIFDRDWWQVWETEDDRFGVKFDYVIASLDSAFTDKQQNDPSGFTVWGTFIHPEIGRRRIMLIDAWRKHLQFSGPRVDRLPEERIVPGLDKNHVSLRNLMYRKRTQPKWGLIEWAAYTCRRFEVDKLLIESKASGISAAQELGNRYQNEQWSIQLCPVKGDKVARALGVQATFADKMIYAPDKPWAQDVIDEMAVFPKGKHDDLTDSATQAVAYLRAVGLANTDQEEIHVENERVRHRPQPKALYPV